jgi:hypothetical protein
MGKKLTRLEKSTRILLNSKATQWCYVNTDNEFDFLGKTFLIEESVEEYKVHRKAGEVEDFTNEAYMDEIMVSIDNQGYMRFYNQNYDEIQTDLVAVIE